MTPTVWIGLAIVAVGLFMLVAGVGPWLLLPIAVIVVGVVVAVFGKTRSSRGAGS